MTSTTRAKWLQALVALCAAASVADSAWAQRAPREARESVAPEIASFEVSASGPVRAGARLSFRADGTPGAQASVRIVGVARPVVLREISSGVYEGSYAWRRQDKANAESNATLTLSRGGQSTQRIQRLAAAFSPPPTAQAPAAPPAPPAPTTFVVSRFTAAPVANVMPGTVLNFSAEGTPGAVASFSIEGVASNVPMQEVRPGYYEGSYTIKPDDKLVIGFRAVASLAPPGGLPAPATGGPLGITQLSPADGATVSAALPVSISGHFDEAEGPGVDPKRVRITLAGRDVTRDASITQTSFTYRVELRPGRYPVEVTAQDSTGRTLRASWSFNVQAGLRPAAPPPAGPLEITSHVPNATVQPGRIEIRGRAAPRATVTARVVGTLPPVAGAPAAVETLYDGRVQADGSGAFRFGFQPQTPVHGTRYEVELETGAAGRTETAKMTLFQQL